jgi:indole-3-glycerol phosphate synthase
MDILDKIIEHKRNMLPLRKGLMPPAVLEKFPYFNRVCVSLADRLRAGGNTGIITEFKKKSPSKGIINATAVVGEVARDYERFGAAAISVLTDDHFFGGSSEDLMEARDTVSIPLLRKDFIIDEYQLLEAKAIGADIILLIAACLTPPEVKMLAASAKSLGLEVLLELHDEEELEHICDDTVLIGINNRSLKTFEVNLDRSLKMAEKIPSGKIKIAESGISDVEQINLFKQHGFSGFLMGENFMKETNPGDAFRIFASKL